MTPRSRSTTSWTLSSATTHRNTKMPFPVIVLEGADCAGKTTLANFLVKRWDAAYVHATYRFPTRMFDYHTAIMNKVIKLSETQPVVLDRWWPSELIYAEAFRNGSPWPMIGRLLDRVALKQGFQYVGCIPSDKEWHTNTFKARSSSGGELFDKNDKVAELYRAWDAEMIERMDYVRYDVNRNGHDLGQFADGLEERIMFNKSGRIKNWDEPIIKDWAGNSNGPLIMLLGDKSNPKGRHELWPFFEHDNSSLFITAALDKAGIPEHRLAWYNTIDQDDFARPELLASIYDKIKPHYVVALGRNASKVAQAADLVVPEHGYRYIHHPSYLMRFKGEAGFNEMVSFFKEIKEQG